MPLMALYYSNSCAWQSQTYFRGAVHLVRYTLYCCGTIYHEVAADRIGILPYGVSTNWKGQVTQNFSKFWTG